MKNTVYIFTFGNTGVGKSTLMAAITKFLATNTVIITNPNNKDGTKMMALWLKNLNKKEFPPRSRVGDIFEIDLGIEFVNNDGDLLQITFLEMSGEDLNTIDLRENEGELKEKFNEFLDKSRLFLVVTDCESAEEDDFLISQFFNLLYNRGADMSSVGLVVSKWDLNQTKKEKKEFVINSMPMTSNWLKSQYIDDAKVFTFSIGRAKDEKILELNLNDSKEVAKWIYETLMK